MKLQRGDRGAKITMLQRVLNTHGFDLGDDGFFGAKTEEAVQTFQRRNGLNADGIAGSDTLRALGLDADSLQPLSGGGSVADSDVHLISFTDEEVTVPPFVQQRIREFAEKAIEKRRKLLMSTLNALDQFETTTQHASASEADPNVLGVLVSKTIDIAVDEMISHVPGLSRVHSIFDTVTGELERAGKAEQSLEMGTWIKDQRAVIDHAMREVNLDDILLELEQAYLDLDQEGRRQFFQQLFDDSQRMNTMKQVNIDELECGFYEQWINAHFTSIGDDSPGCIELRFEYDDNVFDFISCEVKTSSGDEIGSAINHLLDSGQIPRIKRPIDLKVRKRATFRVDNFVGGKSWSSGWLDTDNSNLHTPIHPAAIEAYADPGWRLFPKRFKHA